MSAGPDVRKDWTVDGWFAALPEYAEVAGTPCALSVAVGEDVMDVNGHMNYRHYLELATDSLRPLVAQDLGFGEDYVRARSMGSFVAEHRIRYLAETLVGDRLTGHVRLARQSRRSFTVTVILLNRTSQCLSYALAATYVHVDLVTRRSIPFPPDVERLISASRRDW